MAERSGSITFPKGSETTYELRISTPDVNKEKKQEDTIQMEISTIYRFNGDEYIDTENWVGRRVCSIELPGGDIFSYYVGNVADDDIPAFKDAQAKIVKILDSADPKSLDELRELLISFGSQTFTEAPGDGETKMLDNRLALAERYRTQFYARSEIKVGREVRQHRQVLLPADHVIGRDIEEFIAELKRLKNMKADSEDTVERAQTSRSEPHVRESGRRGKEKRETSPKDLLASFKTEAKAKREDYIGEPDLMQTMDDIIESLGDPKLFTEAMLPVETKLLLAGDPGTGKSLFAETVAHAIGAEFYIPTFSKLGSKWQAESGNKINDILDAADARANKKRPIVLLFDELDGMGSADTVSAESIKTMRDALLTRMERLNNSYLIIIGTTNKTLDIDPALRRPGRFGKPIEVPGFRTAEVKERAMRIFMRQQAEKYRAQVDAMFDTEIDFTRVIRALPKSEVTGAELSYLILLAAKRRGRRVRDRLKSHRHYTRDVVTTEDILAVISDAFRDETNSNGGSMGFVPRAA